MRLDATDPGMVLINRTLPGFETRCVALDDRYGAWLATRHLIQQGHQRIAIICSTHQISDATDRLQGYLDALQEHGIAVDEKLIAYGEPDEIGGEQAMTELLGRGRSFSAVTCYNDPMAAGALSVLSDNSVDVPGHISLIGFDDVLISRYLRPRLTTIRYPIVAMATQAAELALALANRQPLPEITNMFSPTLVRRHSVATSTTRTNSRNSRRRMGEPSPMRSDCAARRISHFWIFPLPAFVHIVGTIIFTLYSTNAIFGAHHVAVVTVERFDDWF